jgi:hypothetical protein
MPTEFGSNHLGIGLRAKITVFCIACVTVLAIVEIAVITLRGSESKDGDGDRLLKAVLNGVNALAGAVWEGNGTTLRPS